MPKRAPVTELELQLARSLYRTDKWDPARDKAEPFGWEEKRASYLDRARRLLRTLVKDGLSLVAVTDDTPR